MQIYYTRRYSKKRQYNKTAWLQTLYTEAWKQFVIQKNLSQKRNSLYLILQVVLISVLSTISAVLIAISRNNHTYNWIKICFISVIAVLFAIFALIISYPWKKSIKSGHKYLLLRFATLIAVEENAGLNDVNLAIKENDWHIFSRNNPKGKYKPYPTRKSMENYTIDSKDIVGLWVTILRVIIILKIIWLFILISGVIIIIFSLDKIYNFF